MGDPAMQDQIVGAGAGESDEKLRPVGGIGGDDADQAGAGNVAVGDGTPQGRADQRVREIVHPYTMLLDLAARPARP